ncbi:MAG: EmrA/EmrK family multidrug efflux transporter periplasmic adaptor subunit [Roseateles depolymerans]|uniref:EmrA/EmrK family multidrug efflux transporter periplasmic adaptor subunit n=1 Tax=Roseateles depolymerans TaxID=76731 RepID=A0A2W5F7K7_9BURK|nr:MAG: EmrA/EmrK family multidrug efflux transporter periplasmic adaptor subunit [Roseateles depolymerans]
MTVSTPQASPEARRRRTALVGITLLVALAAAGYAAYASLVLSQREETDNAYVGGNLVMLSSQVAGNVAQIDADETQLVRAGAELVRLDPADAEVALAQAEARLGGAVRELRERYAGIAQYDATIALRSEELARAEDDLARRLPLAAEQTLPAEEIAHAKQAVQTARAALVLAQRQADAARAGLQGVQLAQHPRVLAARADYVQAWLAQRRNAIVAPVTGYVGKRSVQLGARVAPGTALMSIVPLDQLWVDANFKESELANLRIGQPAQLEADVYGGRVEYHGRVLGLSPGTGSAFSLLPAQNATGNWIKVVQRLPVRIALDPAELQAHPLRIGLSMQVQVDTHDRDGPVLGMARSAAQPVYSTQALKQPLPQAEAAADAIIARQARG